jgi:hypothetical protein
MVATAAISSAINRTASASSLLLRTVSIIPTTWVPIIELRVVAVSAVARHYSRRELAAFSGVAAVAGLTRLIITQQTERTSSSCDRLSTSNPRTYNGVFDPLAWETTNFTSHKRRTRKPVLEIQYSEFEVFTVTIGRDTGRHNRRGYRW